MQVWRVKYTLAKIRKAARELLALDEKVPPRHCAAILTRTRTPSACSRAMLCCAGWCATASWRRTR